MIIMSLTKMFLHDYIFAREISTVRTIAFNFYYIVNTILGFLSFADLQRAFHTVKTYIGLNWRDLARHLPYAPAKEMNEIDSDIRQIEYAYQGQLKEQAYQSLISWYTHCGQRANLDQLTETLRDIHQNYIADKLIHLFNNDSERKR